MSKNEIVIIDYGVGNLLSVQRGFEYFGAKVTLTADHEKILNADRVVLPGVGAFGNAMRSLETLGLVSIIREIANLQKPLLGICLGMQLFMDESAEFGKTQGLGLIPGFVIQVPVRSLTGEELKIPHIGWSELRMSSEKTGWEGSLLQDNQPGDAAYFVHSFMALPSSPEYRLAHCIYSDYELPAVIGRNKITGCQFHPEKSGEVGLKILRRFMLQ